MRLFNQDSAIMRTGAVLVALTLSACATPEGTAQRGGEIAAATFDYGVDNVTARTIARDCQAIAYNSLGAEALWQSVSSDLSRQGYTRADFEAFRGQIDQDKVIAASNDYFRRNNLRSRQAVCAAGRREIAAGSQIGKMLEAV